MAIVTGAASGIGRATAERLTADGASVVLVDIDTEAGAWTAAGLERASFVTADLTVAADRDGVVAAALGAHGRIDILVNNAGVQHVAPIEDFPPHGSSTSSRFTSSRRRC